MDEEGRQRGRQTHKKVDIVNNMSSFATTIDMQAIGQHILVLIRGNLAKGSTMISWTLARLGELAARRVFGADEETARLVGMTCGGITLLATGDVFSLLGYQADVFSRDQADAGHPVAKVVNRTANGILVAGSLASRIGMIDGATTSNNGAAESASV